MKEAEEMLAAVKANKVAHMCGFSYRFAPAVQAIKGLIRRGEARAAGRDCGVKDANLHFLDMPFYETGTVRKKPISDADVKSVRRMMPYA